MKKFDPVTKFALINKPTVYQFVLVHRVFKKNMNVMDKITPNKFMFLFWKEVKSGLGILQIDFNKYGLWIFLSLPIVPTPQVCIKKRLRSKDSTGCIKIKKAFSMIKSLFKGTLFSKLRSPSTQFKSSIKVKQGTKFV